MSDPSLELQGTIVQALQANASVSAFVLGRIYDRVPESAVFPYVEVGGFQTVSAGVECLDSFEVFADIYVWSRSVGQVECKRICAAVRGVLHDKELAVPGFRLVDIRHQSTRLLQDPDGETTEGVITFRALIDSI